MTMFQRMLVLMGVVCIFATPGLAFNKYAQNKYQVRPPEPGSTLTGWPGPGPWRAPLHSLT